MYIEIYMTVENYLTLYDVASKGYSLDKEWHKCQPIDTLLQFVSKRDQLCYIHVV